MVERLKASEASLAKFEKEKEADAKRIADLEYVLFVHVGLYRSEVAGLEKSLTKLLRISTWRSRIARYPILSS